MYDIVVIKLYACVASVTCMTLSIVIGPGTCIAL